MASEPSDDAEMIVLAVHPRSERVALHEGPYSFSYPIVFEGVRGDDLEVDSEVRRMWFEMYGWDWIVAERDSEDGRDLLQTVEDLRNGMDLIEAFRYGVERLGGVVCNNCDHTFEAEGSGGKLGPTCPECGHPANDPKLLDD